jgi:hypothetical protein
VFCVLSVLVELKVESICSSSVATVGGFGKKA